MPPDEHCTSDVLASLLRRYERNKRAIPVNFRKLVRWPSYPDYATHLIHPYPAKLLPHIARFFLSNNTLSKPGSAVADPFCGSGTVLLESLLNRRRPIGADANPLGRLISSVKLTPLRESQIQNAAETVFRLYAESTGEPANRPDVVNLDYWFHPHVIRQLSRLRRAIAACRDRDARLFLLVCLSVCVRKVSLADPRLSVPVRLRQDQYRTSHRFHEPTKKRLRRLRRVNVLTVFRSIVEANSRRMSQFCELLDEIVPPLVLSTDARDLRDSPVGQARPLKSESVTLTITSPPYAGAQKYVRATSLSLGWLDLWPSKKLRECENQCTGREHYPKAAYGRPVSTGLKVADRQLLRLRGASPLRAHIFAQYLNEMKDAVSEMWRVSKPGGHVVLVCGDNRVAGRPFKTSAFLAALFQEAGFVTRLCLVDSIQSRGLMTKRNRTAGLISREWVYLLQKPREDHG